MDSPAAEKPRQNAAIPRTQCLLLPYFGMPDVVEGNFLWLRLLLIIPIFHQHSRVSNQIKARRF